MSDTEVFGIGLDRAPYRLAELVAAQRRRQRVLQHVDRDRDEGAGPVGLVGPQQRQGRIHAMVEGALLEDREVELVVHQRIDEMGGKARMPLDPRQRALARALVGDLEFRARAEREGGIKVEEEAGEMVVVEENKHVGLLLGEPARHRLVALEQRRPCGIVLLALVVGEAYGRHVRGADASYDSRH